MMSYDLTHGLSNCQEGRETSIANERSVLYDAGDGKGG
jgi:hypothetical protein